MKLSLSNKPNFFSKKVKQPTTNKNISESEKLNVSGSDQLKSCIIRQFNSPFNELDSDCSIPALKQRPQNRK